MDALWKLPSTREVESRASIMLRNLPQAFITQNMHANHGPIVKYAKPLSKRENIKIYSFVLPCDFEKFFNDSNNNNNNYNNNNQHP